MIKIFLKLITKVFGESDEYINKGREKRQRRLAMQQRTEIYSLVIRDFAKYSRDRFIFDNVKTCNCCKRYHYSVDRTKARFWKDVDGYVFECDCNSTILVYTKNISNL